MLAKIFIETAFVAHIQLSRDGRLYVTFQVLNPRSAVFAFIARMRFFSGVNEAMDLEMSLPAKHLVALVARIAPLLVVHLSMDVQA